MNKAQLIDKLSGQLGSKKTATEAVEAVIDTVTRAVASGERVAITGFGVFEKVARPARTGRNPRTGATVRIKKTSVPKFKAGQSFKDVVSGAKKLPKATASATKTTATKTTATKTTATKTAAKKSAAKKSSSAGRTLASKRSAPTAKKAAAKKLASKTTTRKAPARKR